MGTTADKLEYLQGTKAAIKSAIINKGVAVPDGTTFRAYAEKIADIIDVPDLSNPGAAGDLRSGKQLVGADGSIVTGTLPEVIQATPTISVSSGGLITASAKQSGGIVAAGSKSTTKQLTTQGAKTVTPTTTNQTAVASGRYTTGAVQVAGDANLKAENIAEGVSIFGVQGTHSGGAQYGNSTVNLVFSSGFVQTINIGYLVFDSAVKDDGYYEFSGGELTIVVLSHSIVYVTSSHSDMIEENAIEIEGMTGGVHGFSMIQNTAPNSLAFIVDGDGSIAIKSTY